MKTRDARKSFESHLARWIVKMGLTNWMVTVVYATIKPTSKGDAVYATLSSCDVIYKEATIIVDIPAMRRNGDLAERNLEDVAVHELTHILLYKLSTKKPHDDVETTTTEVARTFLRLNRLSS